MSAREVAAEEFEDDGDEVAAKPHLYVLASAKENGPLPLPHARAMARGNGACTAEAERVVARTRSSHRLAYRISDMPVIACGSVPGYGPIFNPGVVADESGLLHLVARCVHDGYRPNPDAGHYGPRFWDYYSDLAVFTSRDGLNYEFGHVLDRGNNGPTASYEDARVQRINDKGVERMIMTYTNLPDSANKPWRIGSRELVFRDGKLVHADAPERIIGPDGIANKDGVIFNLADGRVALIHRIRPKMQIAVFDSLDDLYAADASYWDPYMADLDAHTLIAPDKGADCVGAGAPPLASEDGLLCFYHQREGDGEYNMRLALLDSETGLVKAKLDEPILRAGHDWERNGDVNDVIFVQGAVRLPDGTIYLTYGGSDCHVGAALADERSLISALRRAS